MILVVICFCAVVAFGIFDSIKPANFPPGPRFWPFVGSLFLLLKLRQKKTNQDDALHTLGETYGPVLGFRLGRSPPIVVIRGDLVVQALNRDEFSGRQVDFVSEMRTMGRCRGLIYGDGERWFKQKTFTMECLRRLQALPQYTDAVRREVEDVDLKEEDSTKWSGRLQQAVLNVMSTMVFGKTFEATELDLLSLLKRATDLEERLSGTMQHSAWLQHISPKWAGHDSFAGCYTSLWLSISDVLYERKRKRPAADQPTSYLDFLLQKFDVFSEVEAVACCMDLLIAGTLPIARLLETFLRLVRDHPSVLERIQTEMRSVDALEELLRLPYLTATLYEVERLANITTTTRFHAVRTRSRLGQYTVPQECRLLMDLASVHLDPQHWQDPHSFRPGRFVGREKGPHHVPYGSGRRKCPGEHLTQSTVVLMASILLKKVRA